MLYKHGFGRMSKRNLRSGFTLTELLIVVLIIGVLTAIALPQYTKAVDKSRFSTLMPVANHVRDAQEAFYMASAEYTTDLQSAGVNIGTITGNKAVVDDMAAEVTADGTDGYVTVSKDGLDNRYVLYFNRSANFPQEIHCEALSSSDRAKSLCVTMGGEEIGANGSYTKYVLSGTGAGSVSGGGTTTPEGGDTGTEDGGNTDSSESSGSTSIATPINSGWQWMADNGVLETILTANSYALGGYYPSGSEPTIVGTEYPSDDQIKLTFSDGSYLDLTVSSISPGSGNAGCTSMSCIINGETYGVTAINFNATGVLAGQEINENRLQVEKHWRSWLWD